MSISRVTNFIPGTTILSADVDAEFDQLVNLLNGTTSIDTLLKHSHATNPVLNINQLDTTNTSLLIKGQRNSVDTFKIKSTGLIVGVPKCVLKNKSTVGNVGAGLDSLHSLSLVADSLSNDEDYAHVDQGGDFATNDNDKRLLWSFGGQTIFDTGLGDRDTGSWRCQYDVIRLSSTTVRVSGFFILGLILDTTNGSLDTGNSRYYIRSLSTDLTVANLNSNAMTILVQAEATSNDDVTQKFSKVELVQNT